MQEFIGFPASALAYNRDYEISDAIPGILTVSGALVSPFAPTIEGNLLEDLSGGVFDRNGKLLGACMQPRSDGCNGIAPLQPMASPSAPVTIKRAVFGGVAFDHFGHFLLETTARLWCLPEYKDLPWLFLTDGKPGLRSYQMGFLDVLGLSSDQIMPISAWHEVEELIVPQPSFIYHHQVTHAYRDTFRRISLPVHGRKRRRIFLSRSNTTIARTIGESELESVLGHGGWEIVLPELLPPAEQALLFRQDNTLMGLQGSAMHLGLFAPPDRRVVHLCRGVGYRGYYILDDLMAADATYLAAMSEHILRSKPITGPFLLNLDLTISFLRDKELLSPKGMAVRLPADADRVRMETEYQAWWHYTESQTRFHRQIADDGYAVEASSALEPALQALALHPASPEILAHACVLTMKFQSMAAAAALLDRHPQTLANIDGFADAHLLHLHSVVHDNRGEYAPALLAARRAVQLAPRNPAYVNQLGTVLFRLQQSGEAEALLQALIDSGEATAPSHFLLSLIRFDDGDCDGGINAATRALQMDGHDPELCRHLAVQLVGSGRPKEALDVYSSFLDRNPRAGGPLLAEIARLESAMGLGREALQHWRLAHSADPGDQVVREAYLAALTAEGLYPDLSKLGLAVTSAVADQSVLVYHRSLALCDEGHTEWGLRVAVAAVEMNSGNTTIMLSLMSIMMASGRAQDVQLLAETLIGKGHAGGETFYVLSLAQASLGDRGQAREAAARAAELIPGNDMVTDHYRRLIPAE